MIPDTARVTSPLEHSRANDLTLLAAHSHAASRAQVQLLLQRGKRDRKLKSDLAEDGPRLHLGGKRHQAARGNAAIHSFGRCVNGSWPPPAGSSERGPDYRGASDDRG